MRHRELQELREEPIHVRDYAGLEIPQAGEDLRPPTHQLLRRLQRLTYGLHAASRRIRRRSSGPAGGEGIAKPLLLDGKAQVLLIVPPFGSLWYPSIAAQSLRACLVREGFTAEVLYANMLLAAEIGESAYDQIVASFVPFTGERFFARAAFDLPPLGRDAEHMFDPRRIYGGDRSHFFLGLYPGSEVASRGAVKDEMDLDQLRSLEARSVAWVDFLAKAIAARDHAIVGCTTTFQQTVASVAILNRIKLLRPDIVTVLGGANCEGEMATGLLSLGAGIDYIFSGESEQTFPGFVASVLGGKRPAEPIIVGEPCREMDQLPTPASQTFFEQRSYYLPHAAVPAHATYLTYESSRGCWWGQKQHCTFCGLNGEGMPFRYKSADRVIADLRCLLNESPTRNVSMTDNIMPRQYLRTLLPRLSKELPGINIAYEQKSNLTFSEILALKQGGVNTIQPGIEALSSGLLKLMRKGVDARQNLMLLRYGRIAGMHLLWNLICGFPNDQVEWYRETTRLVPLLSHLQPPSGLWHLSIDRFSPYFFEASRHSISNLQPKPVYADFLPSQADIPKIAYHFLADYVTDSHVYLGEILQLAHAVQGWIKKWQREYQLRPELKLCRNGQCYVLFDTRGLSGTERVRYIDIDEASLLVNARVYTGTTAENDAVARKLAVRTDNWFVPLVVARQELFAQLSAEIGMRNEGTADPARKERLEVIRGAPVRESASGVGGAAGVRTY
jgi:ribosomal peptide maturation radical SAM protein 1